MFKQVKKKFCDIVRRNNSHYKPFGFITIKQNERYAIYTPDGKTTLVDGPKRKFIYNSRYEELPWHIAKQNQYLHVIFQDGREENLPGPVRLCFDPINHKEIVLNDAWVINSNEAAIIYQKSLTDGSIVTKTIEGPVFYIPKPNEHMAYKVQKTAATATQYIETLTLDGKTTFIPGPASVINDPTIYASVKIKEAKKIPSNQGLVIFQEKTPSDIQVKIIHGPALYIPDSNEWIYKEIRLINAGPNEYLEITYTDGRKEFRQGPFDIWEDPISISSIEKKYVFNIDDNECIVVYSEEKGIISRRIVKGPTQYVPKSNEWVHNFSWHGADPTNTTRKIPNALKFTKLRTVPDQLYYNVENVRTKDDAELTVKLMIFFQIESIDKLLDESHDPIADLINAVTSDVVDFVSKYRFEEFKNHIDALNDLRTYHNIMTRAAKIGYKISKIVFRGYLSTKTLEAMHNNAIEAGTKLVLDQEVEFQAQKIKDFQLQKERERLEEKLKMDHEETKNKIMLENLVLEQSLKNKELEAKTTITLQSQKQNEARNQEKKDREMKLELMEKEKNLTLSKKIQYNDEEVRKLALMKELGINLTEYLIAKEKGTPSKWIQVDSNKDNNSQIHFLDKI